MNIDQLIKYALEEDVGTGDITTLACAAEDAYSTARLIAKERGVLCGLDVFRRVFEILGGGVIIDAHKRDGDTIAVGEVIANISGLSRSILTGERVALNLLQHLSGVATRTRSFADLIAAYPAKVVDTRKTLPGLRALDKYAVRVGGGANHRFNLSDGVLIKDNHIRAVGGISNAVKLARELAPFTLKIEVECESCAMADEAISVGADVIMLDNMDTAAMTETVLKIRELAPKTVIEASGNMDAKDIAEVAACGVDVISIGALTHSVKALDISLKFD
ncbi:MAG: carboxylating nicotinate-nucleotide diphosphorylase [Oscillospiraceae bacterium]|jgi:nicotinate-nucleotide pyrophosphorylase (carboxylating)|nr:carboxylating nicotinate-nucleotide diphosphorylase [Oscillospiraceae bacterium]